MVPPVFFDQMKLKFSEEVWKEGNMFVGYAPELDIAACGENPEQARTNLLEVIQINFDEMRKSGNLDHFLRDAGFDRSTTDDGVLSPSKQLLEFKMREICV